jgi:hypothetical protein
MLSIQPLLLRKMLMGSMDNLHLCMVNNLGKHQCQEHMLNLNPMVCHLSNQDMLNQWHNQDTGSLCLNPMVCLLSNQDMVNQWLNQVTGSLCLNQDMVNQCLNQDMVNQCLNQDMVNQCLNQEDMVNQCLNQEDTDNQCLNQEDTDNQCLNQEDMDNQCLNQVMDSLCLKWGNLCQWDNQCKVNLGNLKHLLNLNVIAQKVM